MRDDPNFGNAACHVRPDEPANPWKGTIMHMLTRTTAGIAIAIAGLGGAAALWSEANRAPITATADVTWTDPAPNVGTIAEDSPKFNCYTHGNGMCGTLAYIHDDDANIAGAIMPIATDGRNYVSWADGLITEAAAWQVSAGWLTCIANAEGGDASMFKCDADYPGGWL